MLATTSGFCFRAHHGIAQRSLADWKYSELSEFVRTPPRASGPGYYFRTVTHSAFTELRRQFYCGTRKTVPLDLLRQHLSSLMLATWIMDDGAAEGAQLRINTQSFSHAECLALIEVLDEKLGLRFTINSDKGKPRLRCGASSMDRLVSLAGPHVLVEMRYKLPA